VSTHPIKPLRARDVALVDKLRAICLSFPQANERISHGEPTWFAGRGKVFAMLDNQHHGADHLGVWLPLPPGEQQLLVEGDPQRFFRPPYVGVKGWVGVRLDGLRQWDALSQLIRDAFCHVASKTLRDELEAAAEAPARRRSRTRPRKR
jgi:hypothetical protein